MFEDNFDWQDLRRDFLNGVLTSDLLLKNIYVHVVKDGYAARVQDTRSYDSVSRDILSRWAFPLVPDDNHPAGHSYEHTRGNKYIAKDNSVVLARSVIFLVAPGARMICTNFELTNFIFFFLKTGHAKSVTTR